MRWSECCIFYLVLYNIIHYYTTQSAKIPIIHTHRHDSRESGGALMSNTDYQIIEI